MHKTPFYEKHKQLGAKMVAFAGYEMPLHYKQMGVVKEHLHTREQAGLFDVSHMGQVMVHGKEAAQGLARITPVDVSAIGIGKQCYALLTNESGGILDDLIITRRSEDEFFLVVNADCKTADIAHLQNHIQTVTTLPERALLALQGPAAHTIMQKIAPVATALTFMSTCDAEIEGALCYITRSGYTGEDGFEISIPNEQAEMIMETLLSFPEVVAIGLAARDSLRLEAGLCLYGHDIHAQTTPIEAGLTWSISKSRRLGGEQEGGFLGAEVILQQLKNGVSKKRVGLTILGKLPLREGTELYQSDQKVGEVSSGGFSPSLQKPIAMAYVDSQYTQLGTELTAIVRNKSILAIVAKMPFVPQRYYRS